LSGEPVIHQSEGRVSLFVKTKKHHDTGEQGPRPCQIYVTPSRLLLFHELAYGWWGHDYGFEQIEGVEKGTANILTLTARDHDARIELSSATERDSLATALAEAKAGAEPVPVTSDDRLAAEAKVRALRKLVERGKLSQAEYDEQAIQLLGLGTKQADDAPVVKPSRFRRSGR
jgi:hypothetical protein